MTIKEKQKKRVTWSELVIQQNNKGIGQPLEVPFNGQIAGRCACGCGQFKHKVVPGKGIERICKQCDSRVLL